MSFLFYFESFNPAGEKRLYEIIHNSAVKDSFNIFCILFS